MSAVQFACARCGVSAWKESSHVNRSRRLGMSLYCTRSCFGLDRRVERTRQEKQRLKSAYDKVYRAERLAAILARKKEYHLRTYDPAKARAHRRGRMKWHVEYCRRYYADPAKKAEKVAYDEQRRDTMTYGEFAECAKLLRALWTEVKTQEPSYYERKKSQGKYYAINERKRHERAEERRRRTA